jgi:hypothetical protein
MNLTTRCLPDPSNGKGDDGLATEHMLSKGFYSRYDYVSPRMLEWAAKTARHIENTVRLARRERNKYMRAVMELNVATNRDLMNKALSRV